MTRVVAGAVGGRVLQVPRAGTRPTSERVREALFSRLEHLDVVDGARVLDLYAGSGALGIEAASRGAAHVTLVDSARDAADVCRRNVAALGLADRVTVAAERADRFVQRPATWDLVLVDPPYDVTDDELAAVLAPLTLSAHGVLVVERARRSPEPAWPDGMARLDRRAYGDTVMWFAEASVSVQDGEPGAAEVDAADG